MHHIFLCKNKSVLPTLHCILTLKYNNCGVGHMQHNYNIDIGDNTFLRSINEILYGSVSQTMHRGALGAPCALFGDTVAQNNHMNEYLEMKKRVQSWHDNLRPILEEEEKRNNFDVHEYGTQMLNCFDEKGEQKSFKDLVGGLDQKEVARYFVSTIIMSNTNNLKIIKSCDESDEDLKIELLKKELLHDELQVNIGNQVDQEPN